MKKRVAKKHMTTDQLAARRALQRVAHELQWQLVRAICNQRQGCPEDLGEATGLERARNHVARRAWGPVGYQLTKRQAERMLPARYTLQSVYLERQRFRIIAPDGAVLGLPGGGPLLGCVMLANHHYASRR